MYRKCVTRKTAQQQRLFEETLLSAIQEQALSEITVSSLCDRAGLSRNIFYRLFDEKQDVLTALVDHTLTSYLAFSTGAPDAGKESHMEVFFSFWQRQKPLLDGLRRSNLSSLLLERSVEYVLTEVPELLSQFHAEDPGLTTDVMLYHISGLMTLVINWHHNGFSKSVSQMARIAEQILLNPPVLWL